MGCNGTAGPVTYNEYLQSWRKLAKLKVVGCSHSIVTRLNACLLIFPSWMGLALLSTGVAVRDGGGIKLYSIWQKPHIHGSNIVFGEYFKNHRVGIQSEDFSFQLKTKCTYRSITAKPTRL